MKQIIDIETFERKEQVSYFRDFAAPFVTVTAEVECTGARERAKQEGVSFFLYYTHAILTAINNIKAFRYRFDEAGRVVLYDTIHPQCFMKINEEGGINNVVFEYHPELKEFARRAEEKMQRRQRRDDPFELEMAEEKEYNYIVISAMPTFSFTSIGFAHRSIPSELPLTAIGKVVERDGKCFFPFAIISHHAFIDGFHLEQLYQTISQIVTAK